VSGRERAQVIVWFAVMLPLVFLPILGFSIDAGYVFNARRDLQSIADGAARVGGQQIDVKRLQGLNPTRGEDGKVRLDPAKAKAAAAAYLEDAGIPKDQAENGDVTVDSDGAWIVVTAERDVKPLFLAMLHAPTIHMRAQGQAEPCSGITGIGADVKCGAS
jgi:uncharacterized membrane protein